jgi:hypothetical protein
MKGGVREAGVEKPGRKSGEMLRQHAGGWGNGNG